MDRGTESSGVIRRMTGQGREPLDRVLWILSLIMMGVTIVFNVQCAMASVASAVVSVLMIVVMFRIRWLTEKVGSSGVYDMVLVGIVCLTAHVAIRLGV